MGRARPELPHEDGAALTRHEQRRFDEIARRIDRDPAAADVDEFPIPPTTAVIPVRLAAVGLLVVGTTGLLTGLARNDSVVLVVVGIVPAASAVLMIALARALAPASASPVDPLFRRLWLWLTTCAEDAPGHDRGPGEYRGDDQR